MITTPAQPTSPERRAAEPVHACIRCGAPIALADALCAACNPAGLSQPAASQAHGTVYLGIIVGVVAMAAAATFLLGGVGPFRASITGVAADAAGLTLTLSVDNDGSRDGAASCRVWDPAYLGTPPQETFLKTSPVPAHGSLVVVQHVAALGTDRRPLAVDCSR